jgi:hypothetical protein
MHYYCMRTIPTQKGAMMPALQVRDFPPDLYEELRKRAKQEHRSLSQQTVVAIREHISRPLPQRQTPESEPPSGDTPVYQQRRDKQQDEISARIERRKQIFADISARPKPVIPEGFPTIEEIVREMRDSR